MIAYEIHQMAGKGGKGLVAGKMTQGATANKEKDTSRRPISRSSRAGLQKEVVSCRGRPSWMVAMDEEEEG
ncbi:hypothetical protein AgCh_012509 [Apium graveolens]